MSETKITYNKNEVYYTSDSTFALSDQLSCFTSPQELGSKALAPKPRGLVPTDLSERPAPETVGSDIRVYRACAKKKQIARLVEEAEYWLLYKEKGSCLEEERAQSCAGWLD